MFSLRYNVTTGLGVRMVDKKSQSQYVILTSYPTAPLYTRLVRNGMGVRQFQINLPFQLRGRKDKASRGSESEIRRRAIPSRKSAPLSRRPRAVDAEMH